VIHFDQDRRRFNYRIAGVAIHNNSVLLHHAAGEAFWTLPGGRAEHGETADETIRREMLEELETDIQIDRLLWIVENFFEHDGMSYHELALVFLIRFPPDSLPLCAHEFERTDGRVPLSFRWFPVRREALAGLPLYPPFLARSLSDLPSSVMHIVQKHEVRASADRSVD
jgi:8-oxo-dGTP pyrophosphatase MutT (NUDIX family)